MVNMLAMLYTAAAAASLLPVTNHWLANTSGTYEGHINNFIEDMTVWYNPAPQGGLDSLTVLVKSFWDEGSCGYCSYQNGVQTGKAEWWRDHIRSKWTASKGDTCRIENFWGRAFIMKNSAPPTGAEAPFVGCKNGDTIRTVVDPSAIAFDMKGNLLIADNGPDQNIKIFDLSGNTPTLIRTFGDSGGVFAGPVPGKVSARRFWGIRGLDVDSAGNIYVGNTGIPMQTMGGTDIRVFSAKDSSLMWEVQGLSFVNNADADPASSGKDVYLNAKRFSMDYSKNPGQSWKFEAVTLDPFRYPQDLRIVKPMESVWVRRIGGKRFQYHTNMVGGFVYVVRFDDNSEIGIPTAMFCTYDNMDTTGITDIFGGAMWLRDSIPTWERNETNKRIRWYWVDRNGDGITQKAEFGTYDNYNIYNEGLDVDENGDIWMAGQGMISTEFRAGGTTRIVAGSLTAKGVPTFDVANLKRYDIPFTENNGGVTRLKHMVKNDVMYLAEGANAWFSAAIHRYDQYTTANRTHKYRIDIGFDNNGEEEIHLDQNTADMTLPFSFTATDNYIYVGYLDKGADARKRGEITVYDAKDGHKVGWIIPGPETGGFAGTIDLVNGLNAITLADGREIIYVEEDGAGKVEAYEWCPEGAACSNPSFLKPAKHNSAFRKAQEPRFYNLLGQRRF